MHPLEIPRPFAAALSGLVLASAAGGQCEVLKIENPTPEAGEITFGKSIDLRGDRMIIGMSAKPGTALIYGRTPPGWTLDTEIQVAYVDGEDFADSVAIDGDMALVGYPGYGAFGAKGIVYVFERQGRVWFETATLEPADLGAWAIGWSVALEGDRALVGAKGAGVGDGHGRAFVFERTESGWIETANLIPSGSKFGDSFGRSVALDEDRAVIGAAFDGGGAAYVFELEPGGTWVEQALLSPPDLGDADRFGESVAIDGDTVLVGAPLHDIPALNVGAVYVFELVGSQWTQTAKLSSSDLVFNDFGWSVAIEGPHAVVGAWHDDEAAENAGSAYLFQDEGTGWTEVAQFFGSGVLAGGTFGRVVDVDGDEILVGAPGGGPGSAYLFRLTPGAYLGGDVETVSVSQGGTQELQLGACPEHAGDAFRIGGTFSGTSPGFLYQGFLVPLNPDPYFFYTLGSPGIPLGPTRGTFDAFGRAYAAFDVPPGSPPFLVGLELHHAFGVLDATTQRVELVSGPVPVSLMP